MKITTNTDGYRMTKAATFEFAGEKMHVVVAMDPYRYRVLDYGGRGNNNKAMHDQANWELHQSIEGFLHGQISDVLCDARKALGM